MIGIQKRRLADWCNHNTDLLIVICGLAILLYTRVSGTHLSLITDYEDTWFWLTLSGVIILSIGMAALVCYRFLLRWHGFFR